MLVSEAFESLLESKQRVYSIVFVRQSGPFVITLEMVEVETFIV